MYKEKLQELFTERFLNDKIDAERFTSLMEKVEVVSEAKAKKLLENGIATAGTIVYAGLIAGLVALGERYFKYYSRKCFDLKDAKARQKCKFEAKISAHIHEIAEAKKMITSHCPKTKDPNNCVMRMKKTIRQFEGEVDRLENLKSKGKKDIASVLGSQGYHPSHRFPISKITSQDNI